MFKVLFLIVKSTEIVSLISRLGKIFAGEEEGSVRRQNGEVEGEEGEEEGSFWRRNGEMEGVGDEEGSVRRRNGEVEGVGEEEGKGSR